MTVGAQHSDERSVRRGEPACLHYFLMQLCNDQVAFGGSFGRFKIDVDRTTTFATSDLAGNHSFIEYIAVGIGAFVLRRFHLLPAAHNRDRLMTMAKFFHILSILATTAVKGQEQLLSDNETDIPTDDADAADEQSTPICADDEELFRLQLITGENVSWGFASYRIFTDSPSPASETEIHAECVGCENIPPGADVQLCLPKDQCHTTAVGRNVGRWDSCYQGGVEELVMTWGGEIIHESNAYLFASVDFGDGCQDYKRCDDGEAEFEFFLDRSIFAKDAPAFSWELNRLSTDGSEMDSASAPLYEGKALEQSLPFIYERLCVPRSCLQFSMEYPSNTTEKFYDPSPYSIRRDGAIIAENQLRLDAGYSMAVNLGESCTASTACDPRAESLVELEITVNAERKCLYSENFNSSAVSAEELIFKLDDEDSTGTYRDYYVWSGSYADFEIDTLYTYIGCISKDRCVKLSVDSDNFPASYKVYQDGVEMTKRVFHREGHYKGLTTTDLGDVDVCSSGSALSLIQGGVLAAAILLTEVLF